MSLTREIFLWLERMKRSKSVKAVPEITMGKERVEFLARLQLDVLDFVMTSIQASLAFSGAAY